MKLFWFELTQTLQDNPVLAGLWLSLVALALLGTLVAIWREARGAGDLEEGEARPAAKGKPAARGGDVHLGMTRTRKALLGRLADLLRGGSLGEAEWEELEEALITADIGIETTQRLLTRLRERQKKEGADTLAALQTMLCEEVEAILAPREQPMQPPAEGPFVILVAGVNGVGKTTTIGKLARRFKDEGKTVLLAAGDTFRAGAIEQLKRWGERNEVDVVHQMEGAAASGVIFDALQAAKARNVDVLIADTAGRLHTKLNLMEELKKIHRIAGRELEGAPHEVLLVLDATTGQNAINQLEIFDEALGVSGLICTKLDGTAKGGILVAIADRWEIPIRFIGVGEQAEDLVPFRAREFARSVIGEAGETVDSAA